MPRPLRGTLITKPVVLHLALLLSGSHKRGRGWFSRFGQAFGLDEKKLFLGGLRIVDIPVLFGNHQLPWFIGLPVTVLWVLAITNAFNLIDGLDGLAAGSALFSTLVTFVVAVLYGPSLVTVMTIALAGSILGFLRYNFNPATIFLGDSGSLSSVSCSVLWPWRERKKRRPLSRWPSPWFPSVCPFWRLHCPLSGA